MIVDATFIRRGLRARFRSLAERLGVPFFIIRCDAPEAELRRRVASRGAAGTDASEADVAVLESQLAACEPPGAAESAWTFEAGAADEASLARLAAALRAGASG